MLDGYPVNVGDSVYVLGIGSGTVTSINSEGGFSVKTGNGEIYYRDGGYIGNQRRVYWEDPMIITPPKNRKFWKAFVAVTKVLYQQAATFYKQGATINVENSVD